MNYENIIDEKEENKLLISCIFKGMTNTEIAKKLNYSRSGVAYKVNKIFNDFKAKNRIDFIVQVLSEVIKSKKQELKCEKEKQKILNAENRKLKNTIKKLNKTKK